MCLQHTGLNELEIELDQGMSAYEAITFSFSSLAAGVRFWFDCAER